MSWKDADEGKVNPYWAVTRKEEGYHTNCQSCVVCFEARLRGYDVQTLPNVKKSMPKALSHDINRAWIDPDTGCHPIGKIAAVHTIKQLEKWLTNNTEQGCRYNICVGWKKETYGHVFTIYRDSNNDVMMFDPQNGGHGKVGNSALWREYAKDISFAHDEANKIYLTRVDNLLFNPDVVNYILEKSDGFDPSEGE